MTRIVALALLVGCGPPEVPSSPSEVSARASGIAVIAASTPDYATGALAVVGLDDLAVARNLTTTHPDAVVRARDGAVWVLHRLGGDVVRRYVPGAWAAPAWEVSVGRGANPHDLGHCDGALLVTRYEASTAWWLDPDSGAQLGAIDLSEHADEDGVPELSDAVSLGDVVLVGAQRLGRLDGWAPLPEGALVAVDCATREAVDAWSVGPNPVLVAAPGGALVLTDDGVSFADGDTVTPWPVADALPAGLVDAAADADGAVVIAREADGHHQLACVDAEGRVVEGPRLAQYLPDVALAGSRALVAARRGWADPDALGFLLVLDRTSCTEVARVDVGLEPFSVAIVP
jgi:hypothetical protein